MKYKSSRKIQVQSDKFWNFLKKKLIIQILANLDDSHTILLGEKKKFIKPQNSRKIQAQSDELQNFLKEKNKS